MKIIYVFLRRHCYTFDEKLFQLASFRNNGWEIERWSAVNWTFKNLENPKNMDKSDECFYINNENDLKDNLIRIQQQLCYFLIYPYDKTICAWKIRKEIKKAGFKFANVSESLEIEINNSVDPIKVSFPIIFIKEIKKGIIAFLSFCKSILLRRKGAFSDVKLAFLNFWGGVLYKSDINFVTTSLYYYSFPNLYEALSKRNVMIHAQSYDEIMISKNQDNESRKPYVVFVDQYLSGHSDFIKIGLSFPVSDLNDYCKKLCILFEKIEKDFDCEVIIAAHPKAEYTGDEFQGRNIIYGKTNSLVRNALFVLIQTSTCFGLITYLHKSFINIYDTVFFKNLPEFKDYYIAIENVFHCKQLDIGNNENVNNYKLYITNYGKEFDDYNERYVISKNSIGKDKLFYEVVEEVVKKRLSE